jgi:DNA ligase (NAD+)
MKNLLKLLNNYSQKYYNESISLISDLEFDNLKEEYEKLSGKEYEFVGCEPSTKFKKVQHKHPMLSLEKTKTIPDLYQWLKKNNFPEIVIDDKHDGLSVSLIYEYGVFRQGLTRGNGKFGEDITHNILTVKSIPKYIKEFVKFEYIEVRGEGIISKKNFKEMKKYNHELISARNTASGSLRQKNEDICKDRHVDFIAYYILNENGLVGNEIRLHYINLKKLGFKTPEWVCIGTKTLTEYNLQKQIEELQERQKYYSYETDGLVVKTNNLKIAKDMGETGHHPKHSIAYKFKSESEWTELKDVEWNTSATGRVNPIAIVEPIEICDCVINRVSLHNIDIINSFNLKIGCELCVERSNDVIPTIIDANSDNCLQKIFIPKVCPSCGTTLSRDNQFIYCTNKNCPAIKAAKLLKFCEILGIKGIGEVTAEKISHYIDYEQLFETTFDDLLKYTGSQVISKKLYEQIYYARNYFFPFQALQSLFIEGVGETASIKILKQIPYNDLVNTPCDVFMNISGIGQITAQTLEHALEDSDINYVYNYFKNILEDNECLEADISKNNNTNISTKLQNKSFLITGKLSKTRKEVESIIINHGGTIASGVNKNLDYLILGEDAGSKLDKAKKLNIKIINENEFMEMIK